MRRFAALLNCFLACGAALVAQAEEPSGEFFETRVRPILVEHCYECHAQQADKLGGNLLLDSRDGWQRGSESGQVIVPGMPEKSLLLAAVRYDADAVHMPPKGKLSDSAIADLTAWVKMGAPDPRTSAPPPSAEKSWPETLHERRNWWSMRPVEKPAVPATTNAAWSAQPVDRFILEALESQGLSPSGPADPRTLVRRLALVLTGLPPTSAEVDAFLADYEVARSALSADDPQPAVARLVDSLLASPHFGERFARHWLDVVRFSETHGNEWNYEVHHAWRYRDYLIRAFNQDVPYDQFVREHIAGDLLPQQRENQEGHFNESVIGTAFYRFGEANHDDCIGLRQIGYDLADNQIDTLTKAFQATTVACARCHDHKLDAISTQDYHALLGILRSSRQVSHTIDAPESNAAVIAAMRSLKPRLRRKLGEQWLRDAERVAQYLPAAQAKRAGQSDAPQLAVGLDAERLEKWTAALAFEKAPFDDPLEPWRSLEATLAADASAAFPAKWHELVERYAGEDQQRTAAGEKQFSTYADFRDGNCGDWRVGGQGLRQWGGRSGDFVLHADGDTLVKSILPSGCFTHSVSEKLNGTLRSPVLPAGPKHISFCVLGERSAALRLVSNNCQLNYKNYRALISNQLGWITFAPPEDRDSLRVYAELMTMLDNPKFPDQLSALGGDKANYKLPWEQAAANPRSYFGVTRVVLHDGPEPPPAELSHLRALFAGPQPQSLADVAARYQAAIAQALHAWTEDHATDEQVRWLDALLRAGLLTNTTTAGTPLAAVVQEYRALDAQLALPQVVPGVADGGAGFDQPVLVRGDCFRPGPAVARRYLEVLSAPNETFTSTGSGRLELAERIASPDNPLTARVMVNRLWQYLFGVGLVRTVDDFGHVGDLPSHPELLDYLAATFVEEGWSIKRLIRTLVLTRTFQMADARPAAAAEVDPQNRLLSHYSARRLEAEAIRDAILATSGRLDRALFGMSVQPYREAANVDRRLFPGPLDGNGRRSIYIKNNLMEAPKFLSAFDLPGGKVSRGRRDATNVPAQALALLNDPFVLAQADQWAGQLVARADESISGRIDSMFRSALSRAPRADEQERFSQAVDALAALHQVAPAEALHSQVVWRDVAHAMFNLKEFIYIP